MKSSGMKSSSTKSTDNTVFIRFTPPSSEVNRWHLEELFSQVGPIKKCSVIASKEGGGLGYGFVKFVSPEDAQDAAKKYNEEFLHVGDNKYRLKVSLASAQNQTNKERKSEKNMNKPRVVEPEKTKQPVVKEQPVVQEQQQPAPAIDAEVELMSKRKRTSRVIIRNLSFYADEKHIKAVLEKEFGPIVELTLPRVNDTLHRGFCFCTFEFEKHAKKATEARATPLYIKKRGVAIDFAVAKAVHQRAKDTKDDSDAEEEEKEQQEDEDEDEEMEDQEDEQESEDDVDDEQDDEEVEDDDGNINKARPKKPRTEAPLVDEGVSKRQTVFIRNLPFDTDRNDIFQILRKFGHIESIYPVMDRDTGVFKGTAFCSFKDSDGANRALDASSSSDGFQNQRDSQVEGSGLHIRGRRLFMDLAVDKQTASTLTMEKQDGAKTGGKDRRCLYLSSEGYISSQSPDATTPDAQAWESLPESDQLKRQRALTEKTTKLKSPLFFINPKRLSIRNLAKNVDEADLKELCVKALRRGLAAGLVKAEDQVSSWRADGLNAREVMTKINEAKEENEGSIIPEFTELNVKKFIPSVFIDRDFTANKKEKAASRGFGFADFTHHAHALACLREMNNNMIYSAEYVPNGKKANEVKNKSAKTTKRSKKKAEMEEGESAGGRNRVPRLIVEFTVENKAKAQQQVTNRVKQQANIDAQKLEQQEKKKQSEAKGDAKAAKKKHRGALQREKKRKQREEGHSETKSKDEEPPEEPEQKEPETTKEKKKVKPQKKQKVDKEDQTFEALVRTYTDTFKKSNEKTKDEAEQNARSGVEEKRWFE